MRSSGDETTASADESSSAPRRGGAAERRRPRTRAGTAGVPAPDGADHGGPGAGLGLGAQEGTFGDDNGGREHDPVSAPRAQRPAAAAAPRRSPGNGAPRREGGGFNGRSWAGADLDSLHAVAERVRRSDRNGSD
jgi:hypothetical protein